MIAGLIASNTHVLPNSSQLHCRVLNMETVLIIIYVACILRVSLDHSAVTLNHS